MSASSLSPSPLSSSSSRFDLTAAQASLYSIAVRMKPRTAASVKANSKPATVSRTDAAVIKQVK